MTLANDLIEWRISDDAKDVNVVDKRHRCERRLDPAYRLAEKTNLSAGSVEKLPHGFRITHQATERAVVCRWMLASDYVRVELESAPDTLQTASLRGAFMSGDGPSAMLLSISQVLYRPTGEQWWEAAPPGGHWQFSMAMNALLGTRVVANVSDKYRDTDEFGLLKPNTWKEIKPA